MCEVSFARGTRVAYPDDAPRAPHSTRLVMAFSES